MKAIQLHLSPELALPEDAVTETFAILAKRGSGKTYTGGVLVEELLKAHLPVCVVDPLGVWWGLRSSADGKSAGEPVVIFGGDHADVPLQETAGELVADVIITERIPAVIDLSGFSKSAARRFMTDFAERLYHRNRDPLHLVVDEADAFAPQRPQKGAERLLGAMEDIVRRGRARGLGCTMITQRAAVLNKDVLTQIEALIVQRMTGPRDVQAIDEWVRLHATEEEARTVKASLPSLPIGTAWIWSPGWLEILQRVQIRQKRTFDSSATPKAGQRRAAPRTMADVDIAALGERITATAEQAKADDPKALRARIRELERLAAQQPTTTVEQVEVPVLTDEDRGQITLVITAIDNFTPAVQKILDRLPAAAKQGSPSQRGSSAASPRVRPDKDERLSSSGTATQQPAGQRPEMRPDAPAGAVEFRAGARRMVEALGRMAPLRLTKAQWGMVAKLKTTGGTWSTYFNEIRRAGFIDETPAGFTLTDAGFEYLGVRPEPMTAAELQNHYRTILRAGAVKMLDALIDAYPAGFTRDQLGDAAGIVTTGGTFSTYLNELVRNQLAYKDGNWIFATEILMHGASA